MMSDTDTETPEMPEMDSYTITTVRTFEVDLSERQRQHFMEQAGTDDPGEAVEQVFVQRELNNVAPEQKLLRVQVDAQTPDGSSD